MSNASNPATLFEFLENIQGTPSGELIEIADKLWESVPEDDPKRYSYAITIAGALHGQYANADKNN